MTLTKTQFLDKMALLADELGLIDPVVVPPVPPLVPPMSALITTPKQVGVGGWQSSPGAVVKMTDRWYADYWALYRISSQIASLEMRDIRLENMGPLVTMRGTDSIVMERIESLNASASSSYGLGLLRATDTIGSIRVSDFRWEGAKEAVNAQDAWAAIALWGKDANDTCSDWEIKRGIIKNARMASGTEYANADGISTENGHINGLIEDVYIEGVSDAGLDIKGDNVRINQVEVVDARQSFKLWGASERHGRLISRDPRFAHIIAKPTTAPVVIDRLEVFGELDRPVIAFEGGVTHYVIKSLEMAEGQKLYTRENAANGSTITMPDGRVITIGG